jgi:hypothetical protein
MRPAGWKAKNEVHLRLMNSQDSSSNLAPGILPALGELRSADESLAPSARRVSNCCKGLARRGIIRAAFIRKLLHEFAPARPGACGEMLWILLMLNPWMQTRLRTYRL